MSLTAWFSLATICTLGAMSPGPSLAIVLKNTLAAGRSEGVRTALAHGFGVGLYAFATAAGLAVLITGSPLLFTIVQWLGAFFLAYLGCKALFGHSALADSAQTEADGSCRINGLRSGFLTAFLNPKLAIFFAALFSQFVSVQAGMGEKMIMALTAATIDASWYILVALLLSHSWVLALLRRKAGLLDKTFGVLLLGLAIRVITLA
ncbi:MAG: LysE family translocator [Proteobacteria bacterium]|nr:LysE family translocator [Pseudomonadota bacterium]MBU1060788.1 LysE family translocator [Pseudomonadota bacterium]